MAQSSADCLFRDRLDTQLPDFTRLSWVSDGLRAEWEPRIQGIGRAWNEMEWLTAAEGLRPCALVTVSPEELVQKSEQWMRRCLYQFPFDIQGAGAQGYSATSRPVTWGAGVVFRLALGKPDDLARFQSAVDANDDSVIGRLLGFPECCRTFFKRVWVDENCIDTTWAMAVNSGYPVEDNQVKLEEPVAQANILWRWMGVRPVWHLPCSFHCEATVGLAETIVEFGRQQGFDREMDWLLEILDWPVEWSGLHGIAEIKTPVLKVSTRTDATAGRYTVRYFGGSYPSGGVPGLRFPYRPPRKRTATGSTAFRRGIENEIVERANRRPEWYASDNGFSSVIGMEKAHAPIVSAAIDAIDGREGTIADLGCGNGALLKRIWSRRDGCRLLGIDGDGSRIDRANSYEPVKNATFLRHDLFECADILADHAPIVACLLMPGRLIEVEPARSVALRRALSEHVEAILVYAYGDWLTRYGDLAGLVAQAPGLSLVCVTSESTALARIDSWT